MIDYVECLGMIACGSSMSFVADVRHISMTSPSTCRKIKYSSRSDTPGSCPTSDHRWSATQARLLAPHRAVSTAATNHGWLAAAAGSTIGGHRLGGPDAARSATRWTRGPILRAWTGRVPTARSGRRRGDLTPTSPTCVQRARTGTNRAESLEQPLTTFRALWTPCSRFAPDKIPTP
jgi:hypothetical protein